MNVPKILELIRPGSQWTCYTESDGTYELVWQDEATEKPSLEEMEEGQAQLDALAYRQLRASEYPTVGDQLDAIWKGGDASAEMSAKVRAVKEKYPKP